MRRASSPLISVSYLTALSRLDRLLIIADPSIVQALALLREQVRVLLAAPQEPSRARVAVGDRQSRNVGHGRN